METTTVQKDNSKKNKINLLKMSIKRNDSTGITLKIQSQRFANFFKNNSTVTTGTAVQINGLEVSEVLRKNTLSPESKHFYQFYDGTQALKNSEGEVNMAFLLEARIGTGVEFKINGRYSVEAMHNFKTEFKKAVSEFYIENMQIVKFDVNMDVLE
jgi:hypothetical protein